ncbi:hypothetical protein OIU84_000113 [Salix udensis]|uniref:Uncharacterized protein n=1 Tax=Salix udensis TaxID=889485 RepID=A0AAD6L466_9ROSI|nr:hypothetical protein OIU84_000113 [Salix udensis]
MRWGCLLQWVASNFHHKGKFDHMMVRQAITGSVYFLRGERNARVFNNKHKEAATISKEAMMQLRILLLHYKKPIPVRVKESLGIYSPSPLEAVSCWVELAFVGLGSSLA